MLDEICYIHKTILYKIHFHFALTCLTSKGVVQNERFCNAKAQFLSCFECSVTFFICR